MNTDVTRKMKLGRLHQLKAEQGLDDDTYRDKLQVITGHRSAKDCTDEQLVEAINKFHVKQNANKPHTRKAKAIFIAAYNLGIFEHGNDTSLDAFVKKQTGKERLTFLTPPEANSVTEALKAMCLRVGFQVQGDALKVRQDLLAAQWAILAKMGEVRIASTHALDEFLSRKYLTCRGSRANLNVAQLDDCARSFGAWIRRSQVKP